MPHTLAPALTDDRAMWKRLLRRCHPDLGVDESLYVWSRSLHERVAYQRREDSF